MTESHFVLASGNAHKADEISAMLPDHIQLTLQSELGVKSVPEPAVTFVENALIKARHACEVTGLPSIADDSGICVDALSGAPGVISARYAGQSATDAENRDKLLAAMEGETNRAAAFFCTLVCLSSPVDPAPLISVGRWSGLISDTAAGDSGFGYDPVFFVPEYSKTAAELSAAQKNAMSHRGQALASLVQQIRVRYST